MPGVELPVYAGTNAPPCYTTWRYRPVGSEPVAEIVVQRITFRGAADWEVEVGYQQSEEAQLSLEDGAALNYLFGPGRKVSKDHWLTMIEKGYLVRLH